ncbi:MAG TPA: hypothetical protein V6D25_02790 [Leptolyngbyaceae cyanobacterium]
MSSCQVCGGDFRLNVVSDRHTGIKFLRAGCCDSPLRQCPSPDKLLRSASHTSDERNYLQRVAKLNWFGSAVVASNLLRIEAKIKASGGVAL